MKKLFIALAIIPLVVFTAYAEKVTVLNSVRAETDMTMDRYVKKGALENGLFRNQWLLIR